MAALDFSHSMMSSTTVFDKDDFFRSGLPEMHSLKSLINVASRLFKIPTTNIILGVLDDVPRVYTLTLLETSVQKLPFGKIMYLPLQKRLEIYDMENPNIPLHVWIKKKIEFSRTSVLQQKTETHKSFDPLINTISF